MTSTQRLRIAYLVSKYPDFSHTFILREVLALRSMGIEIDLASINDAPSSDRLTQIERDEAARTFYVKRAGVVGALAAAAGSLLRNPGGTARGLWFALRLGGADLRLILLCVFYTVEALILGQWMRERNQGHLHVHFATPAATVALILTKIAPVTFSMTVHGSDEFYEVRRYFLAEKLEAAKFVVCISWFAQSQLMKLTPGENWHKFDIARLGVDVERFASRGVRETSEVLQLLCVGRLVFAKGQRILLEAFAELRSVGCVIKLDLVGDGADRADLERWVRDRGFTEDIRFAGALNQDQVAEYYKRADVFVLPSFAEGIPVVLMEAMAMEIPCVTTRITGIPELIEGGVDGLLVAPSDVAGLASAIATLMDSAELRRNLGAAGRAKVLREYELHKNVVRLREIFERRLGPQL